MIRQDPQPVAFTSPTAATGVFEVDIQSEPLNPFGGTGVDTTWFLELPQAANTLDFDSLMDVIITYDYTALINLDLRDRGGLLAWPHGNLDLHAPGCRQSGRFAATATSQQAGRQRPSRGFTSHRALS
ncbi:Tc toxin subunit A-related protein [Nitrospira sp. CMX1]